VDDRQLYQTLLGLTSPWFVDRVEINVEEEQVLVYLGREASAPLCCPECGQVCPGYDESAERRWRHLDTCQYQTHLVASIPRVKCPEHGVRQVSVPWSEQRSRFTALFETTAIRLLQEMSLLGLTRVMNLSWEEAAGIQRRAVHRGLARRESKSISHIGVDETSFQKRHEYVTVVNDVKAGEVIWVGDHRGKSTLDAFWQDLGSEQCDQVEEVVMDMWEPYIQSTREALGTEDADIVFDRFHVVDHLNRAVDQVRRAEHRHLMSGGNDRLKGTRYLWLKKELSLSQQWYRTALVNSGLKVGRAWAIKEAIIDLWDHTNIEDARQHFKRWYYWATHSRLNPIIRVAKMMKKYLQGILNYLKSRLTNALTEWMNAKIQEIKLRAKGYRNRENFRMAILFHCGGLDMDPR
jgi:transposase